MKSKSNKLNVVDRATFECIQQHSSSEPLSQSGIRNSKYKRRHKNSIGGGINLVSFLTLVANRGIRQRQKLCKLQRRRPVTWRSQAKLRTKRKVRETGGKKQLSRLKKSILRHRQKNRLHESKEVSESETVPKVMNVVLEQLVLLTLAETDVSSNALTRLHSRRFRSYCNNCTTPELAQLTEELLRQLYHFQRRAFAQNEIKAHAHRRFVVGLRETQSFLRINKVKMIVLAPDCEECVGDDGLDATIASIKVLCQQHRVPYAFALRRRQLAYALYKKAPVSCVAIIDYDGARDLFAKVCEALQNARHAYVKLLQETRAIVGTGIKPQDGNRLD